MRIIFSSFTECGTNIFFCFQFLKFLRISPMIRYIYVQQEKQKKKLELNWTNGERTWGKIMQIIVSIFSSPHSYDNKVHYIDSHTLLIVLHLVLLIVITTRKYYWCTLCHSAMSSSAIEYIQCLCLHECSMYPCTTLNQYFANCNCAFAINGRWRTVTLVFRTLTDCLS